MLETTIQGIFYVKNNNNKSHFEPYKKLSIAANIFYAAEKPAERKGLSTVYL